MQCCRFDSLSTIVSIFNYWPRLNTMFKSCDGDGDVVVWWGGWGCCRTTRLQTDLGGGLARECAGGTP